MKRVFTLSACLLNCVFGFVLRARAAPVPPTGDRVWKPEYATYLGGSGSDGASDVIVDAQGNFYLTGSTDSPAFPGREKSPGTLAGDDAFLCKFSPDYRLLWTRFLGGSGFDHGHSLALDKAGRVYVVGNCPKGDIARVNAPELPHGKSCAFLGRFSADGKLETCTLLGGSGWATGRKVALDGDGNIWLAGDTRSKDVPTKGGTLPGAGRNDVWVSKLAPTGELLFSVVLGGSEDDALGAMTLAPDGGVALTGATISPNFPVANAQQEKYGGTKAVNDASGDAWLASLDANGKIRFVTYFGGRGSDAGTTLAFAPNGDLWMSGFGESRDFPLKNPLPKGGHADGDHVNGTFLARFKGDGSQLLFSSFEPDAPGKNQLLLMEPNGDFWLKTTLGSFDTSQLLTHFSAEGASLVETISWPALYVNAVARDGHGALYLAGATSFGLPTRRALLSIASGQSDAFVAVLKLRARPQSAPKTRTVTISVDETTRGVFASGTTNVGANGDVQLLLYRSADSQYWTGFEWSTRPAWLSVRVNGTRWERREGMPPSSELLPGVYYLHAVAISDEDRGPEYARAGRTKAVRKIVIAP